MKLSDLTRAQIERIYCRCYRKIKCDVGYQPFGMDLPTLLLTNPTTATLMKDCLEILCDPIHFGRYFRTCH